MAAGTRPDPAVSVPKLKGTIPLATATEEPELEPPLIYSGLKLFLLHRMESEHQPVPLQTDQGWFYRPQSPLLFQLGNYGSILVR